MTLDMSPRTQAVRGVLIEPSLGAVTLDLSSDRLGMRFANAHVESFPRSAVSVIDRDERSVTINWGGTAIVLQCSDDDGASVLDELNGSAGIVTDDDVLRGFRLGYESPLSD